MIGALFGRGAGGIPVEGPMDFAAPPRPASPNWWMALPEPEAAGAPRCLVASLPPADVVAVWGALGRVASGVPRCTPLASWPERWQAQWVVRSAVMNFPDVVVAEVTPSGGLRMHSRSLIGWSDMGVNRKRVEDWVAALAASLR